MEDPLACLYQNVSASLIYLLVKHDLQECSILIDIMWRAYADCVDAATIICHFYDQLML